MQEAQEESLGRITSSRIPQKRWREDEEVKEEEEEEEEIGPSDEDDLPEVSRDFSAFWWIPESRTEFCSGTLKRLRRIDGWSCYWKRQGWSWIRLTISASMRQYYLLCGKSISIDRIKIRSLHPITHAFFAATYITGLSGWGDNVKLSLPQNLVAQSACHVSKLNAACRVGIIIDLSVQ